MFEFVSKSIRGVRVKSFYVLCFEKNNNIFY